MNSGRLIHLSAAAVVTAAAYAAGRWHGARAERIETPAPWAPAARYGVAWRERRTRREHAGPVTGGSLERALWAAGRLRAAGFARVRVVILDPDGSAR